MSNTQLHPVGCNYWVAQAILLQGVSIMTNTNEVNTEVNTNEGADLIKRITLYGPLVQDIPVSGWSKEMKANIEALSKLPVPLTANNTCRVVIFDTVDGLADLQSSMIEGYTSSQGPVGYEKKPAKWSTFVEEQIFFFANLKAKKYEFRECEIHIEDVLTLLHQYLIMLLKSEKEAKLSTVYGSRRATCCALNTLMFGVNVIPDTHHVVGSPEEILIECLRENTDKTRGSKALSQLDLCKSAVKIYTDHALPSEAELGRLMGLSHKTKDRRQRQFFSAYCRAARRFPDWHQDVISQAFSLDKVSKEKLMKALEEKMEESFRAVLLKEGEKKIVPLTPKTMKDVKDSTPEGYFTRVIDAILAGNKQVFVELSGIKH